ncbi:MAG: hypothetical protein RL701_8192 [Pseudomonadota bacterium]
MRAGLRCALIGLLVLLSGLSWASGSARADIPSSLRGQPVLGVRVAGDTARIAGPEVTGIAIGERLDRGLIRRAIEKLLSTGRWVDVQVEAEPAAAGVVLVFRLEPRLRIHRVEVRGQDELDQQIVTDALGLAAGVEVRVDALSALESNVRRAYAERGFLGARVTIRFRDTDHPAEKVLLVEIVEGGPTRITKLECSGSPLRDPSELFSAMGLSRGDTLDRRALTAALAKGERFLRSEYYLEARLQSPVVAVRGNTAELTFPLHLGPRYRLEVRGSTPLKDTDIATAVFLVDAPLTSEVFDAMPTRIKDIYAQNGFLYARAGVSRKLLPDGRALLLAQIEPGRQLEVARMRFPGAQHFTTEFLREQVVSYLDEALPGSGLLRTVDSEETARITHGPEPVHTRVVPRPQDQDPQRTYYEPTYLQAVKHIAELYQAAGFLSVQVSPPTLHMLDDTHGSVAIRIVEGPQTLLHSVVLHGQEQVSTQELLITAGLRRGAPFSYLVLEEARTRLQESYQERGHMFVRIEPSVRFSSDRTRAEVRIEVVEGFAVTVGDIVVHGAARTDVAFVRSLLSLKRGDVFRPSQARASEHTLSALGVMASVTVQLEEPDLPARVKRLVVTVSERSNQFLDFSAGLSTGQGARAGFDYGYRNLFGYAVGLTLRVQFAYQLLFVRPELRERFDALLFSERLERNVALGLALPRWPGLGATRVNLDLVHVRDNERDFGLDKNGITLAFTETPLSRVTLLEAVDLEHNNIDLFVDEGIDDLIANTEDVRVKRLLRVPKGSSAVVALRLSASYDHRDNPFLPTRGFFISASSEIASTLQSEFLSRFVKLQITGSGYIPLGRSIVFAGQVRVGRILHLDPNSKTYPNRAFFLGGVETMRGYYQDELIPQDVVANAYQAQADENRRAATAGEPAKNILEQTRRGAVRAGDAFILVRGELRFPLVGQLGGGLFADFGNLWADAANMNPLELRPTAGAGLRLNTPVGPIAVDYGFVLIRRPDIGEPRGTLHFSIGLF